MPPGSRTSTYQCVNPMQEVTAAPAAISPHCSAAVRLVRPPLLMTDVTTGNLSRLGLLARNVDGGGWRRRSRRRGRGDDGKSRVRVMERNGNVVTVAAPACGALDSWSEQNRREPIAIRAADHGSGGAGSRWGLDLASG